MIVTSRYEVKTCLRQLQEMSKKISTGWAKLHENITMLLVITGLDIYQLSLKSGLGRDTLLKVVQRKGGMNLRSIRQVLDNNGINLKWWETGTGDPLIQKEEIIEQNNTSVDWERKYYRLLEEHNKCLKERIEGEAKKNSVSIPDAPELRKL